MYFDDGPIDWGMEQAVMEETELSPSEAKRLLEKHEHLMIDAVREFFDYFIRNPGDISIVRNEAKVSLVKAFAALQRNNGNVFGAIADLKKKDVLIGPDNPEGTKARFSSGIVVPTKWLKYRYPLGTFITAGDDPWKDSKGRTRVHGDSGGPGFNNFFVNQETDRVIFNLTEKEWNEEIFIGGKHDGIPRKLIRYINNH
jgi:hypothetical protein